MGYLSVRDIAEMAIEAASENFKPDYAPDQERVRDFLNEIESIYAEIGYDTEMQSFDINIDPETMEITVVFVMEDGVEDYVFDGVWVRQ